MFSRDMQRIMENMRREMELTMDMMPSGNFEVTPADYNGHRVEVTNGEVTEEYLVDGEWMTKEEILSQRSDEDSTGMFEMVDGTFTVDLSNEVTGNKVVGSADFNNGVLTVEFESGESDDE